VAPIRAARGRLAYLALTASCLLLFVGLTALVMAHRTEAWDGALMLHLAKERRAWLTVVMEGLSIIGSGLFEFPFAILLLIALTARKRAADARWYGAAVLSGWALYAFAKLLVHRPRPHVISRLIHEAGWYSYPSGHAMLAPLVLGLGIIAWTARWSSPAARRAFLAFAPILALAVGLSRVYLGVHYPSDVIGGLLLGTAWSGAWILQRLKREPVPST
jgi:undecaprenyl-diphosphatase